MISQALLSKPEARKAIEELRPDLVEFHRKLLNDTGLARRCLANFQRDGRSGFYDPEWQNQAREAFERHRKGDFDDYLQWKLYQDWPELEELDKSREKAAAEAHATKMAEMEKQEQEEEQRGFKTDVEDPASVQTPDVVQQLEQDGVDPSSDATTEVQATKTTEKEEQTGVQLSTVTAASDQATKVVEEHNLNGVQPLVEAKAQGEAATMAEKQEKPAVQPLIEAQGPAEASNTAILNEQDQDQDQPLAVIQSPKESEEAVQVVEMNSQNEFQASKESTERLPTTPPREHSPDVQCINDSQDHRSSSQNPIEDVPKPLPLTTDVQLDSLPRNTLVS